MFNKMALSRVTGRAKKKKEICVLTCYGFEFEN